MTAAYIGEIRIFGGTFAPVNWSFCDGSIIQISQNTALYQLIGTTYGGNGQTTFMLPDLRSRVPVAQGTLSGGSTYVLGQPAGTEQVTLSVGQMAKHSHPLFAATANQSQIPSPSVIPASATSTQSGSINVYGAAPGNVTLGPATMKNDGQSLPHPNIQPYLAVNYIICLYGIYPPQS